MVIKGHIIFLYEMVLLAQVRLSLLDLVLGLGAIVVVAATEIQGAVRVVVVAPRPPR